MKKEMKGGKYNFLIKNTSSNKKNNDGFIPSEHPLIFNDKSKDTFEEIYNIISITVNSSSKPFVFDTAKRHLGQYYVLYNKNGQVYLQKLGIENKIFTVEPIISPAEYFFGRTALHRIQKYSNNQITFQQIYDIWERELLQSIETNKITVEDIRKFLFMKKINRNITKNKSSFNQHIRKLSDKNSNYYDYSKFKGIPRDIDHYLSKFFKNHPKYDPRPKFNA